MVRKDVQEVRAQVEQLVAGGKVEEAYDLLVSKNWVPEGSGYQVHFPTGLVPLVQVDWNRWILVSETDRLWAWESTRYVSSAISHPTKGVIGDIPGVVEIAGSLYAKSPEALKALLKALHAYGYEIKDCSHDDRRPEREVQQKKGWSLWFASLGEKVLQRRGKCNNCGSHIDTRGIRSHKHQCEICGEYTYLEFTDGTIVRLKFLSGEERRPLFSPKLKMRVYDYDETGQDLFLYAEPEDGGFGDYRAEDAKQVLEQNQDKWRKYVTPDGQQIIVVHYNIYDPCIRPDDVIEMYDVWGHVQNHKIVKLFQGKEYDEWDRLPVWESFSIYEAWHWMPLPPSPRLHEKIIGAAGMVADCGYYYQDGRQAFYEGHLRSMRLFVEHFTLLDLDGWDKMIARAPYSGPGMIRAVATFCHEHPEVTNAPNIGNVLVVLGKGISGERITEDELAAAADAMKDPEEARKFPWRLT